MRNFKTKILFLALFFIAFNVFAKQKQQETTDLYELTKTGTSRQIYKRIKNDKYASKRTYGPNGDSLIMVALEASRDKSIINLLLDYEVDVDAVNKNGDTAVIYAVKFKADDKILKTLITYEANSKTRKARVAHKNNSGQSAIDFAVEGSKQMKLLLKYTDKPKTKKSAKEPASSKSAKEYEIPLNQTSQVYDESEQETEPEIDVALQEEPEIDELLQDEPEEVAEVEVETEEEIFQDTEEDLVTDIPPHQENIQEEEPEDIADYSESEELSDDLFQEQETAQEEYEEDIDQEYEEEVAGLPSFEEPLFDEPLLDDEIEVEEDAIEETRESFALSKEEEEELIASREAAEEALKKRRNVNRRMYLLEGYEAYETYDDSIKPDEPITDPDARDKDGRTLLQNAAANDDVEKINRLVKAGADLNLTDNDSWTALMYAARFAKKRETVSALLKGGAELKTKNRYGITALQIAASFNSNPEILDELAKHSAKKALVPSFIAAVGLGRDKKIIEVFFKYGVSPNIVYKGKTPLMYAAETNTDTNCIKYLLECGADKTFITADLKDAYYFACRNPNLPRNKVFWSLNNSGK